MADQVVDLEEAVGSYLNCLSTSCAAGSKLYTSVGKLVDEKFQELFPSQETKIFFQVLQTQNACEGYQKALLECKEKLLEILIDNHTKRQPTKDKVRQGKRSSPEEQYAGVALRVAKELYCYHQTVAEVLKPLHFSDCQEDIENATLMNIEGKSDVVQAWMTIVEGNKLLRSGYGLSNAEVSQILCWQHGEDMTESSRKRLNQQVNQLIQQYVDRMYNHAMCELDIPIAFSNHPDEIQKILQSCCSPTESLASSAQTFLTQKEEITTMLHRELPRTILTLNNKKIDKAHPGKAYENATLKMRAVRESISNAIDAKQIDNSKEQVDLFCLRILAMGSLSYASAACRTAVLMAFGKSNLVQVQPIVESDKHIILDVNKDTVNVNINTKWAIVEDGVLFNSLCRGNLTQIATIYVTYHVEINIEQFFVKRITPIPVAHVTQCILQQAPSNQNKKEQGRERSKSIRIKLTRATKLFQRKSVVKTDAEADFYAKDFMQGGGGGGGGHGGSLSDDLDLSSKTPSENGYTSDSQGECSPVPPPRHKRKAKKTKKSRATTDPSNNNNNGSPSSGSGASSGIPKEKKSKEAKKEDLAWFSASDRFGIPLVPTVSGSKDQSPSIASFEELQGVIDFLSGSSTSSLAINEKGEKIIRTGGGQNLKTHKRNNSTTSLPQTDTKGKTNAEGKLKLCHKKSASFSGKASDLAGSTDTPTTDNPKKSSVGSLTNDTFTTQKTEKQESDKEQPKETSNSSATESSSDSCSKSPTDLVVAVGVERTPGDGMDHKINKDLFQSTSSIDNNITQKPQVSQAQQSYSDSKTAEKQQDTTGDSTVAKNETQTAQKEESTGNTPENVNNKKEPYFEPSDITGEIAHLRLSKQSDIDVVKSLPSDLNAHAQTNVQPFYQQQKSSTLAALEITTTVNQQKENMPSNVNWQQQQQPQQKPNDAPSPLNIHPKQTAPPQFPQQQPRVSINSSLDPSAFEFEKQQQKPPQLPASSDQQNTLYEPFNSRTAWPGFGANPGVANGVNGGTAQGQFGGGSRFKSLWSEATLDNDKGFPHDERPSLVNTLPPSSTSGIRSSETEFTFDKQQDLHKLLEGSSFMKGGYQQNNFQDSWKDRHMSSYPRKDHNNLPQSQHHQFNSMQHNNNSNSFEGRSSSDPWPVQSQSNFGRDMDRMGGGPPRGGRDYSSNKNSFQQANMARMNIESLQLPPNPVGPYMRQNREQLLAKQQILEQFARQQKQMQIQQKQQNPQPHGGGFNQLQSQQQISFPPSHPKNNMGGMSNSNSRQNMPGRSNSTSGPPGFNNDSNKFDQLVGGGGGVGQQDWNFHQQRPSSTHSPRPFSTQGYPSYNNSGNGGFSGLPQQQTRSVGDVRGMSDNGFPDQMISNDRLPQFRDQYNSQVQDVFSSRFT